MGSFIGGGAMSYTTFGTFGRGGEGDKKYIFFTFDLFTLSIYIHNTYSNSMRFSSIFNWKKKRIIPYLCEIDVRTPTSVWSS